MQTTFKLFFSFLFCLALLLVGGCDKIEKTIEERRAQANQRVVFSYIQELTQQVERFALDVGRPPTTEEGLAALVSCPPNVPENKWAGPYIKSTSIPRDPWGNEYQYVSPGIDGSNFHIWSFGPDGNNWD